MIFNAALRLHANLPASLDRAVTFLRAVLVELSSRKY